MSRKMKIFAASLTCVAFLAPTPTAAWGERGHQTVGYIAMTFLAPNALKFVESTIDAADNHSLGPVATWPDAVRKTPEYSWSGHYHYVDVEDDPLNGHCGLDADRDCGPSSNGCILTAIANYTTRVANNSLPRSERQEALKFLVHFFGDIGQPLHAEGYALGGNRVAATCHGVRTNLHSCWDDRMPDTYLNHTIGGELSNATSIAWAARLVEEIKTGAYSTLSKAWIACSNASVFSDPQMSNNEQKVLSLVNDSEVLIQESYGSIECPVTWARESNALICSHVFSAEPDEDLCDLNGTYFVKSIPIIELQIAKQGYRLAAWLNTLFDGAPLLPL